MAVPEGGFRGREAAGFPVRRITSLMKRQQTNMP